MNYTKHKTIRVKELNKKYTELVFERKGLEFNPCDALRIYTSQNNPHPLYIASEPSCGWVRLIVETTKYPDILKYQFKDPVKLEKTIVKGPKIDIEAKNVYVVSDVGIVPVLSLISTFPHIKHEIWYVDDQPINLAYLQKFYNVKTECGDIEEDKTYYLLGSRTITLLDRIGGNVKDHRY